jgi:hypothetical protein
MQLEITPEPTPEEREALLIALEEALAGSEDGPAAWWQAGVRESVEDGDAVEP